MGGEVYGTSGEWKDGWMDGWMVLAVVVEAVVAVVVSVVGFILLRVSVSVWKGERRVVFYCVVFVFLVV